MNGNRNLNKAAAEKNDEFYTQFSDVAAELRHYVNHFKNKTVYCNCDDPRVSAFFKYFTQSFEDLKLKKVIASCYKNQNIDLFSPHEIEKAVYIEYTGRKSKEYNHDDIEVIALQDDGDFRNAESTNLLKQADIVSTNPPFSLFREYVAHLVEHNKKFLILGNMNAVTYAGIFPLIKSNKMWLGVSPRGMDFNLPDGSTKNVNAVWYTNLDIRKRHEELMLYKKYRGNKSEYPKYDNYDAVEVSKVENIPADYAGIMGVPITFLDKYNPEQFEIVGCNRGVAQDPNGVYGRGSLLNGTETFKRLFIRNRNPKK